MPRPQRCRRICCPPRFDSFSPDPEREDSCFHDNGSVILTLDEYEVIRLVDLEKKSHEQCAAQMDISRSTATEIYESARTKIAQCIVYGKRLLISGGNYRVCQGQETNCCTPCWRQKQSTQTSIQKGVDFTMKIAVTYENGKIFQHFGHTSQFKIYDTENGQITSSEVVDTNGSGHGALAGFLRCGYSDLRRNRRRRTECPGTGWHPAVRRRFRRRGRSGSGTSCRDSWIQS